MKKTTLFIVFLLIVTSFSVYAQKYDLASPNGEIEVEVSAEDGLHYSIIHKGNRILEQAPLKLELKNHGSLAEQGNVTDVSSQTVDETINPVVPEKKKSIRNHYKELKIEFNNNFSVVFRAFNEGMAYRFVTDFNDQITVKSETVRFHFSNDHDMIFNETDGFMTGQENPYGKGSISEVPVDNYGMFPTLVDIADGPKVVITEANLYDYPGMYFQKGGNYQLKGVFPHYVTEEEQTSDRDVEPRERADYLAVTDGSRTFPWRVVSIAETDGDLITNQMVYKLSTPCQLENTDWIQPGNVAWDWWNATNIHGVDFKAGVNTKTYKHYIDFAAEYGLDYIILDEGWSDTEDLFDVNPDIDLEEITDYAESKDVGVILWMVWKVLDDQLDRAMDRFEELGIKGLKIDFMNRDDQWMVNYYKRIAQKAAEHHLLIDFHGSYKPTGLRRAYPNILTRESVKGLEHNKWSSLPNPEINVTIPFIRMLAGPMDYTPGAMNNAHEENFCARFTRPMSMGTRCHQMAMYVIYESPLQMLSDSPTNYREDSECTGFIADVPVVWDDTRVLSGKVGEYVSVARKKDNTWYVGAMTNSNARDLEIDLSFLESGDYTIEIFRDGINAERHAEDYKRVTKTVTASDVMNIHLASGGGWIAKIEK
jgi:alpha-glucosidase